MTELQRRGISVSLAIGVIIPTGLSACSCGHPQVVPGPDLAPASGSALVRSNIIFAEKPRPRWLPPEVVQVYGDHWFRTDGQVTSIAFSRDGSRVAAGVYRWAAGAPMSGAITIWSRDGEQLAWLPVSHEPRAVGFCAGDRLILADSSPSAWALADLKPAAAPGPEKTGRFLAISSSGKLAAYRFEPPSDKKNQGHAEVRIFETKDWTLVGKWPAVGDDEAWPAVPAFSPDEKEVAIVGDEKAIFQSLLPDKAPKEYPLSKADRYCLSYFPDGRRLLVVDGQGVTVRDRSMNVLRKVADQPRYAADLPDGGAKPSTAGASPSRTAIYINAAVVSPNGNEIYFSICRDGPQAFDLTTGKSRRLDSIVRQVAGMCPSPDGQRLAIWGDSLSNRVELLPVAKGRSDHALIGWGADEAVALSPDGRLLMKAACDSQLELWDAPAGKRLKAIRQHVRGMALDGSGQWLAVSGNAHHVAIYSMPDLKLTTVLASPGERAYPTSVAFSNDGRRLYASMSEMAGSAYVCRWQTGTWQELPVIQLIGKRPGPCGLATAAASRADCLLVGTDQATAELWLAGWKPDRAAIFPCPFRPKSPGMFYVHGLAMSPDGRLAAAITVDGLAYVWDTTTSRQMHVIDSGPRGWEVRFAAGGRYLITAGSGLKVWDLHAPAKPVRRVDLRVDVKHITPPVENADGTWLVASVQGCENAYLIRLDLPK